MIPDEWRALRSTRVVLPDGVRPARIALEDGRIESITGHSAGTYLDRDVGDDVIMPGLVDTHVHVNEPGRTDWEGFATASRAALAGGVTTLVDMPLNSIPATTTVAALDEKRRAAARCHPRPGVHFWGGVVPGNVDHLEPLARAGVRGFKCFLVPSGVPEFEHVTERDLRSAMPVLARLGLPLLAHAELPDPILRATAALGTPPVPTRYADYARTRPPDAEIAAIELLIRLCREFGTRVHIVHLAAADALPLIAGAKREGLPLTCETCPHYLYFDAERIGDGAVAHKCAPPIRDAANREGLWRGLEDGTIDMIVTDHSPAPPSVKDDGSGDLFRAWGGIASLQLGLAAVWTRAAARGIPVERLAGWMCEAPARLAALDARTGRITPGFDADFVVWNPDAEHVVDAAALHHRHPITAYAGERLRGAVTETWIGGSMIFSRGEFRSLDIIREGLA